ncbi:hypothetical protein BpHYR1_032216 [Brachionus plicatilis]|uniref:Uncharacterized protein n=1 Tax=Brachionus plicatilis TaxID=10195 RepID=A0A3M7R4P1_BRAPC|nr:hypothetical protein BpHYR1_032216 [Brachionus plicatilis]
MGEKRYFISESNNLFVLQAVNFNSTQLVQKRGRGRPLNGIQAFSQAVEELEEQRLSSPLLIRILNAMKMKDFLTIDFSNLFLFSISSAGMKCRKTKTFLSHFGRDYVE